MPDAEKLAKKKEEDKAHHKALYAKFGWSETGQPLPLPGDPWAARHPRRAQIMNMLTGLANRFMPSSPPVTYGLDANGMPLSAQAQPPQGFGSPAEAAPSPTAPVAPNETVVPKSPMLNRGEAARQALRSTLTPAIASIHSKYGVSPDDIDTVLNNFIDTSQGRKLSDQALSGQDVTKSALSGYENFVKSWTGSGKQASKTVKMPDPVVVNASDMKNVDDWRKALRSAANNTVVIDGASDKGFMSDKVIVVKGTGTPKFNIEHALDSHEPPVLNQNQFVQALKKAGMSGG